MGIGLFVASSACRSRCPQCAHDLQLLKASLAVSPLHTRSNAYGVVSLARFLALEAGAPVED